MGDNRTKIVLVLSLVELLAGNFKNIPTKNEIFGIDVDVKDVVEFQVPRIGFLSCMYVGVEAKWRANRTAFP